VSSKKGDSLGCLFYGVYLYASLHEVHYSVWNTEWVRKEIRPLTCCLLANIFNVNSYLYTFTCSPWAVVFYCIIVIMILEILCILFPHIENAHLVIVNKMLWRQSIVLQYSSTKYFKKLWMLEIIAPMILSTVKPGIWEPSKNQATACLDIIHFSIEVIQLRVRIPTVQFFWYD
jgi:hypothetical protein